MIYTYAGDPEAGTMGDESIVEACAPERCGSLDCTGYVDDMGEHLEPVYNCFICERDLENPDEATSPICDRCTGTAKATAHYFPEGPGAFGTEGLGTP